MRVRGAQHQRVHRRLRRMIIGVAAATSNERIVFLAQDALTDAKFDGSHCISGYTLEAFHIAAVRLPAQTHFRPEIPTKCAVSGFAAPQQKAPGNARGLVDRSP
jgi:hypothetical protein